MRYLSENFLLELFSLFFRKKNVIEVCLANLEYYFLPSDPYKALWQKIELYYKTNNKLPTYGLISQEFNLTKAEERKTLVLLDKIKAISYKIEEREILKELESYIKDSISVDFFNKFEETYNKGDREGAKKLLITTADKIANFSIEKDIDNFTPVFKGILERLNLAKSAPVQNVMKKYTLFGIDELDKKYGVEEGEIFAFLAQSGVGKSQLLRWIGMNNALAGFKVLHIQLEGTKSACENGYDAALAGLNIKNIKSGDVSDKFLTIIQETVDNVIIGGGEVYIEAYEQFGTFSLSDLRNIIISFIRKMGIPPHLILVDYLDSDICHPGDGKKYSVGQEKELLQALGRGIKNLAMEFNTRIGSAFQASNVFHEKLNDPLFVLTRHDTKGDKNVVSPFSFFHTLNQTQDEYKEGIIRLYEDKIRDYKGKETFSIAQNYNIGRFYDRKRTIELFHSDKI